jgi:hypothetical protein
MLAGACLLLAATVGVARISERSTSSDWLILMALRGMGFGLLMLPAAATAFASLPAAAIAKGTAVFNVVQGIAASFGIAVGATFVKSRLDIYPHSSGGAALAFDDAFGLLVWLTLLALPVIMFFRPTLPGGERSRTLPRIHRSD